MAPQRRQNRVGDVAYARLNRQKALGQASSRQLARQKLRHVRADLSIDRAHGAEAARLILQVRLHNADDLRTRHRNDRRPDAIARRINRNLPAIRRIGRLVDVVDTQQRRRIAPVQFDQDIVGLIAESRRGSHSRSEHDAAARRHVASLHHRPIHMAQKPVAGHLRHQRKVHVAERRLALIDSIPQVVVGLVRSAEADRRRLR